MRILIIFLIVFTVSDVHAQTEDVFDTAKRIDPFCTDLSTLNRNYKFNEQVDSGMLYIHQYNAVKKTHVMMQDLGDLSTPYLNAMYQPQLATGIITGFNPYGDYYYYNKNAKFYQAKVPFSSFNYVQGKAGQYGRGMISFDATHTQNIGKRFNLGVNFHSTTNEGYYQHNATTMKNLQYTNYYVSKNSRYIAALILSWNKTLFNENGGIFQSPENDSAFRNSTSKLRFVPVELVSAKNVGRHRDYQLSQTYWLKGKYSKDSLATFTPQIGITYNVNFQKQSNYYTDQVADFNTHIYDSVYYQNANYSADSMGYSNIGNSFEIFSPLHEKGLSFSAGGKYESIQLYQQTDKHNYHINTTRNISIFGQLNFNFLRRFKSELKGNYFLSGYNQTDFLIHWKNEALLKKDNQLKLNIDIFSNAFQPTWQQQLMLSNHYQWNNNFNQQFQQSLSVGLSQKFKKSGKYDAYYYTQPQESYRIRLNYILLSNYMYYGYDAKPAQLNTAESIIQLYTKKHFNIRKFQIHEELVYQLFSNGLNSKILLPKWLSKTSLYFQSYAFKRSTFVQLGMDINYSSDYQSKFYNPGTRNFQLSNTRIGNYPFADLFINAEIKTIKLYLKFEHFNQDLMSTERFPNYFYTSPFQPSSLRRVRLGFVWKFYY